MVARVLDRVVTKHTSTDNMNKYYIYTHTHNKIVSYLCFFFGSFYRHFIYSNVNQKNISLRF